MQRNSAASSAAIVLIAAVIVGILVGYYVSSRHRHPNQEDGVIEQPIEDRTALARRLDSRNSRMRTPRLWLAFTITFHAVEAAGKVWLTRRPSGEGKQLTAMADVVKVRRGAGKDGLHGTVKLASSPSGNTPALSSVLANGLA